MKIVKQFLLMVQFYTRIPIPVDLKATEEDYGKGLATVPLVGAIIGGLCALVYWATGFVAEGILPAVCTVVFYCYITGALHIDGLGDTFDGIFSNRDRERMLAIMKDSRIGTNALVSVLSVLLLNIACIASLDRTIGVWVVFLMPVIGRLGSCLSCGLSEYARPEGMGKSFITVCGPKQMIIATVLTFGIFWYIMEGATVVFVLVCFLFTFLFVRYITKKIGGMTGDTSGAACELNQTLFLGMSLLLARLGGLGC